MARVVPPQSMGLVRRVVADVTSRNHGALLSFGLLGALWTCSSGFATMIEALNVAYDVPETRSCGRRACWLSSSRSWSACWSPSPLPS